MKAKLAYVLVAVAFLIGSPMFSQTSGGPNRRGTLLETLAADGSFNIFTSLVRNCGMAKRLRDNGPFTIVAPTDKAFAHLPADTVDKLFKNSGLACLFVNSYIVQGKLLAVEMAKIPAVTTVNGHRLDMAIGGDGIVSINHGRLIKADIASRNGFVQGVDGIDMVIVRDFLDEVHKAEMPQKSSR